MFLEAIKIFLSPKEEISISGLTAKEEECMAALIKAYEIYAELDPLYDMSEFNSAIHTCQQLLALRIARRTYPGFWR